MVGSPGKIIRQVSAEEAKINYQKCNSLPGKLEESILNQYFKKPNESFISKGIRSIYK